MNRREFLRSAAVLAASAVVGGVVPCIASQWEDVPAVEGTLTHASSDPFLEFYGDTCEPFEFNAIWDYGEYTEFETFDELMEYLEKL